MCACWACVCCCTLRHRATCPPTTLSLPLPAPNPSRPSPSETCMHAVQGTQRPWWAWLFEPPPVTGRELELQIRHEMTILELRQIREDSLRRMEMRRKNEEIKRRLQQQPAQRKAASTARTTPSTKAAPPPPPPSGPGLPRPRHLHRGLPTHGLLQPRLLRLLPWPGPPLLRGTRRPPKQRPSTLPLSLRCNRPTLRQSGHAPRLPGALRTTPWTRRCRPTRRQRLCSRRLQRWRRPAASSASAAACRADALFPHRFRVCNPNSPPGTARCCLPAPVPLDCLMVHLRKSCCIFHVVAFSLSFCFNHLLG